MDLDTMIVTIFCQTDDCLKTFFGGVKVRRCGRSTLLSDAEVLTVETVGEYLGLAQDKQIFEYFRRHHRALFPALGKVHRTTSVRQAANLWRVKERLWLSIVPTHPDSNQNSGKMPAFGTNLN